VLARELGDVEVLSPQPLLGLDRRVAQIQPRSWPPNRGAAVLLVSEDLDELLDCRSPGGMSRPWSMKHAPVKRPHGNRRHMGTLMRTSQFSPPNWMSNFLRRSFAVARRAVPNQSSFGAILAIRTKTLIEAEKVHAGHDGRSCRAFAGNAGLTTLSPDILKMRHCIRQPSPARCARRDLWAGIGVWSTA